MKRTTLHCLVSLFGLDATGKILAFVQDKHPPAPTHLYRSRDHGKKRGEMK